MTVPASVTGKVQYEGDGETSAFSIDFPIFLNTQGKYGVRASVADENGDNATVLTEGTDFTITVSGTLYHTLTLYSALAVGCILTIIYDNEFSQLYAPTDFTSLPAATLIKAFDKLTGLCIQIKEELERCVKETAESTTDPNIVIQKVNVLYEKIQILTSVCDKLAEISTVSANILNVNSLADITVQISTLAEQITALLLVSTNISNVNTCSSNIAAIVDAPNQASAAASFSTAANVSATEALAFKNAAASSASAAATSETNAATSEANAAASASIAKGVPLGTLLPRPSSTLPAGFLWCDGSEWTRAQFPDFYDSLVSGEIHGAPYTDFAASVAAAGICAVCGLDTVNQKFKTPLLNVSGGHYLVAGDTSGLYGAESLPNIKGKTNIGQNNPDVISGSFKVSSEATPNVNALSNPLSAKEILFDASLSSATYQDGAKVNTRRSMYKYMICVYNTAVPASEAQAAEFINGLSGKANLALNNVSSEGKKFIALQVMPSGTIINNIFSQFIAGIGQTYTAPANGTVNISRLSAAGSMHFSKNGRHLGGQGASTPNRVFVAIPCKAGDVIGVVEEAATVEEQFTFFEYAQGEI